MTRLNENGHATDAGTDPNALDMLVVRKRAWLLCCNFWDSQYRHIDIFTRL